MKKLSPILFVAALLAGCDPAQFRPAKGVDEMPASKDAYRVHGRQEGCVELGFVIQARDVEDIAITAARHGGTHYEVLDDFGDTTTETDVTATQAFGAVRARATSRQHKHHLFTARVYRC